MSTHDENVFYVHEHELEAVVDGRAHAAWERYERRLQRGAHPASAISELADRAFQRQPERPN